MRAKKDRILEEDFLRKAWQVGSNRSLEVIISGDIKRYDPNTPTIAKHSEESLKLISEYLILSEVKSALHVVRLNATRIAKYCSIAILNCNFQIPEGNLRDAFDKIYGYVLDYSTSRHFKLLVKYAEELSYDYVEKLVNKIRTGDELTEEEKELSNLYFVISKNFHESSVEMFSLKTAEEYFNRIIYNKFYMKNLEQAIITDLEPKLIEHAQDIGMILLTPRMGSERLTCFVIGAPASGKGVLLELVKGEIIDSGRNWSDIAKFNTDYYRDFIIDKRATTTDFTQRDNLNQFESVLIAEISNRLYKNKLKIDKAPDLLVDTVPTPSIERIENGLLNGASVKIYLITLPTEKCVERAYLRGERNGRFVPLDFILNANASIAKNFHNQMIEFMGRNLEYKILDNDVELEESPIEIESANLLLGLVEVKRVDLLVNFLRKANINTKAKFFEELYPKEYYSLRISNLLHSEDKIFEMLKV